MGRPTTSPQNKRTMTERECENTLNPVRIADLCFVYARAKWMRTFKAFDLEGHFAGRLLYASMLEDNEDNRCKLQELADKNAYAQFLLQLRKGDSIVFETRLTA